MLILWRKAGESIVIGEGLITIHVYDIEGGRVKLGITAPQDIRVDRHQVHELRSAGKNIAGGPLKDYGEPPTKKNPKPNLDHQAAP